MFKMILSAIVAVSFSSVAFADNHKTDGHAHDKKAEKTAPAAKKAPAKKDSKAPADPAAPAPAPAEGAAPSGH
ncbi:MAG TPA: hypothetical protein PKC28_14970 [Bdellovibrionales bacterium]|nr:hypothetical protein [Bdellovibrionales bacterium]